MNIETVTEIQDREYRVGLVPGGVKALTAAGHEVVIQNNARVGSNINNEKYEAAGATILNTADEIFVTADMVIKVKEPLASEVAKLHEDQILFTYLHLAPLQKLTQGLLDRGVAGVPFGTITAPDRSLPLPCSHR